MYTSSSAPTLLSSVEPQIDPVHTFFQVPDDFVQFFSGSAGMYEILLHEDISKIDIKLQPHGLMIVHSPDVTVRPIEMSLWKFYYDVEFIRCLRLSVLNSRCAASQAMILNPAQYALLHETKLAVTRNLGLTEVFMEEYGRVCLYGSVESVVGACITIKHMFNEHGLGDPEIRPPAPLSGSGMESLQQTANTSIQPLISNGLDLFSLDIRNPQSSTDVLSAYINPCIDNTLVKGPFGIQPESESAAREAADRVTERTSIRFFVNISDAPRLIGTRGATKRRIEQVTGCTILLHTEKKENNAFPIEVFSTSVKRCEIARQHILRFLAGTSTSVDSTTIQKCKEIRARPKVHLDISPKKTPKKHPE